MSRSYKKHIGFCDRNPYMKNQASRKIRRKPLEYEFKDGCSYRKESDPWDICDFKSMYFGSLAQIKTQMKIDQSYWVHAEDRLYRARMK